MHQQVNLYRPELRHQSKPFSAVFLLILVLATACATGAITGYSHWQLGRAEALQASIESGLAAQRARNARMQTMLARINADDSLEQQIAEGRKEIAAMRRVLDYLERIQQRPRHEFSDYLGALARRPVQGLWLTRVGIQGDARELELSGSALEPALLPRFIDAIGQEDVYRGREFRNLRISREEPDSGPVVFRLSTREAQPE